MNITVINKYFTYIILFCVITFSYNSSFCQINKLTKITNGFENYIKNHLSEKIYVHTDRSYYLCGNILWFKIYIANEADNKLLSVSKVAYVEVLNAQHQPVLQSKIAINNGTGSGSFDLSASLISGNYELRAYTNWMKNDLPDQYFKKIITIINTTQNLDVSVVHNSIRYAVQFLPEGGNLVNGLSSVIGFKVNNSYGKGIDCQGIVVDQSNDTIVHFKSSHLGMGQFLLTPQKGKHYKAIVILKDSLLIKELPEAYNNGYVMHIDNNDMHQLKITVQSVNITSQSLYLLAKSCQHIDFVKSIHLENNQSAFLINEDSLANGLAQITLFDEDMEPVCERLYFKRPKNKMLIQAIANKQNYNHRDKVNINLLTTNEYGDSIQGDLSVSVYKLDSLQEFTHENIFSYLWLSSNCKGYVENPDYYFTNDNAQASADLDNLLLTQGWRKFDWDKALQSQPYSFNHVPENYGHIITGRVTNDMTGKPVAGILAYLSVPGKRIQLYGNVSNDQGLIHFDLKDFYGANQIILQTNTTNDTVYHLEIFSAFSEKYSDTLLPALHVLENCRPELEAANLGMRVENAYHQKDIQLLQLASIDTIPFYYKPSKTYLLDNYTRFTSMEEVMREYVAQVNVSKKGKKYYFFTLNQEAIGLQGKQITQTLFDKDPLMLYDGVPVFNADSIITYDPLKVQKIEIVTSKYYHWPIIANGIVSYTTYKGNLDGYHLNSHNLVVDYDGLQQQRIFYSPDYSSEETLQSRLPDFRNLLYWSPGINTNAQGKGNFSFYTGDVSAKYLIVLQGISSQGEAGVTQFIINVKT